MRELVLILIMAVLCLALLVSPRVGLLGYVWFTVMRPDILAFSRIQYQFYLAILTLLSSMRHAVRFGVLLTNPIFLAVLLLQVPYVLSAMTAVNPDLCWRPLDRYLRVLVMALLIPLLVETEVWLRRLILVIAVSVGVIGSKFAASGMLGGGVHFTTGYGGMISDNNGLALALVMGMPLCWYSRSLVTQHWQRMAFLGLTLGTVTTIVMTQSRGNAIALALVAVLISLRTKYKLGPLIGLGLLSLPVLYLKGDSFFERMGTLGDVQSESSAASRIDFARAALAMASDYPLLGVGYGETNQQALMTQYLGREDAHVIHNTYLQVLVDSGVLALVLHGGLLWGTVLWLGRSAKRVAQAHPEWAAHPRALQLSLIAYGVSSSFYSRADFELFYIILLTAAAWYEVQRTVPVPAGHPQRRVVTPQPSVPLPMPLPARTPAPAPARWRR